MSKKPYLCLVAILTTVAICLMRGQDSVTINHYEYAFPPGSVDVYDMDSGFSLVKSVSLPQTKHLMPTAIRGAVASGVTGMLYVSYGSTGCSGGQMLKYKLMDDTVVWTHTYPFGIDSMSISPDGQRIYMPTGEGCYSQGIWQVIDANSGNAVGKINSGGSGPHNTVTGPSGSHVYMGPRYSGNLVLGDTISLSAIRDIGPVLGGVRPFTINSEETYAFITTSGKVGFYAGSITTGKILYWVCPPGFCWTRGSYNKASGVSHGISLSPDEKEVYLIDYPYNHVHVFDVTGLPGSAPVDVADIPLKCRMTGEGWLQHSRDGRFVFVGDCGDVIDTATRRVGGNLPALLKTQIFNEVDFRSGVPYFSPLSRNQGGYLTQSSNVSLSTTSLDFGYQTVGTRSSPQTVTLTNKGSAALSITGIAVTGSNGGDFAETNTCGGSVAAGAKCTISVTFAPTASATRTAAVTITDSDPSSPQTVSLTGTGVAVKTTASVSPSLLRFGNQALGSTSPARTVTLSNAGSAALTITGIAIGADYTQTNNCGSTVKVGASCTISVTFTPSTPGARKRTLTVISSAANSPQRVSLTGTALAQ